MSRRAGARSAGAGARSAGARSAGARARSAGARSPGSVGPALAVALAVALATVTLLLAACGTSPASSPSATAGGRGATAPAATSPLPVGPVSHVRRWLTDAAGRVVMLHGVNMVEKSPPYYPSAMGFDSADAAWLESNGLDVVRLGVLGTGIMPTPGHVTQPYIDHLAATVATLGRHHISVLLDMHQDGFGPSVGSDGFPAWMTLTGSAVNNHAGFPSYYLTDPATQQAFQSLWDNAKGPNGVGLQTDVADMFGALAKTFARSANVIGYDVFNEPWPGTTWEPCLTDPHGCASLVTKELDPLYAKVDRAIRRYDHTHIVFAEPFVLFNYGTATTTVARPAGDPATGMAFHQYATSPAAAAQTLKNAVAWSATTGGALLATEWGATTTGPSISAQADQFDHQLLPWIFWSFDGAIVKSVGLPPGGSNLVTSTVDAVVRPYPTLIAGTPTSISYDATTHHFTATWTDREPDGRMVQKGTVSSLAMPAVDYPNGYTVSVSGARVTSKPCSRDLRVATGSLPSSSRGSGPTPSVQVTVSPGGGCRPSP
ncbi:MAG: cellulase family glycosylhydrolase [Acidimicrobiales bacterium]